MTEFPTVPAVDLSEVTEQISNLVEVLQTEAEAEAKAKAEEEVLKLEQEELQNESLQKETSENESYKTDIMLALNEIDGNLQTLNERTEEYTIDDLVAMQIEIKEMYEHTLPSVKHSSDLSIIFLCLIPLFLVVKWLSSMFSNAFR